MNLRMTIAMTALLCMSCGSSQTLRYPPSRWLVDLDRDLIEKPKPHWEYKYWDVVEQQFFYQLERILHVPDRAQSVASYTGLSQKIEALNVNNFDEIADSTWFTNRIGRYDLMRHQIARGPNRASGPEMRGPYQIIAAKTTGISPGFLVEDGRGDKYLLKFDSHKNPEMASGAEIISTRFFHGFGYNVPENYLIVFDPARLQVSLEASKKDRYGRKKPYTKWDLLKTLKKIPRDSRGYIRAVASRLIEGEPIGPFKFKQRRWGDKNDRIPHEHRRELRGYRVFASWLNHTDSRGANTLDMFVRASGKEKGFVQHYLIDFGATLGSATFTRKSRTHHYDYRFHPGRVLFGLATLGLYRPYWEDIEYLDDPAVGLFESRVFRPERWKPSYPNPAFQNMTPRDAFWATKILMQIRDDDIAAVVDEARYSRRETRNYMIETLIKRRNKIGRYWYGLFSPLDNFHFKGRRGNLVLEFDNLWTQAAFDRRDLVQYRYRLLNKRGSTVKVDWRKTGQESILMDDTVMSILDDGRIYQLQVQAKVDGESYWKPPVNLFIQRDAELKILGVERQY